MRQHNTSPHPSPSPDNQALESAQKVALRNVLDAVHREGYEAENLEDAWGKIIRVQAEIALDPAMGSKATTAAKFLSQVLGIANPKIAALGSALPELEIEAVKELFSLIAAERNRRDDTP